MIASPCLNCGGSHAAVITWRLCWGCGSYINACAPITSAAYGERVTVHRPDGTTGQYHAHTACLDMHAVAAERPQWRGRLSQIERPERS